MNMEGPATRIIIIPDPRKREDFSRVSCFLSAAEEKGLPKGLLFLEERKKLRKINKDIVFMKYESHK